MNTTDRARRTALLCCHFARNFAYYSVFRSSSLLSREGFWLTVHGNFADACVLEWCKLFGNDNEKEKYHWRKVVSNPEVFRQKLLSLHGIDDAALLKLRNEVKAYRNHFVAHLDEQETTPIPNLNVPYLLVAFYFRAIQADFPALGTDCSLPPDLDRYYDQHLAEAKGVLQQVNGMRHA